MYQLIKALETMLELAADEPMKEAIRAELERVKAREETRQALDFALKEYK